MANNGYQTAAAQRHGAKVPEACFTGSRSAWDRNVFRWRPRTAFSPEVTSPRARPARTSWHKTPITPAKLIIRHSAPLPGSNPERGRGTVEEASCSRRRPYNCFFPPDPRRHSARAATKSDTAMVRHIALYYGTHSNGKKIGRFG